MIAKWCFPSSNGGEKQGLNNSGIETFNDNPIKSLAREICQNSLDAVIKDQTAIVEFKTFSIDNTTFPDQEGFHDILTRCYDFSRNNQNPKTPQFFLNAINRLDCKKITMLRISDFNTTGLKGSDWDNLVNSSGASEKSEGKGGSFGIGKNAPFACSEFRTVFYSTLNLDNEERCKGVSRLISHKLGSHEDGSDDISQGTGYFGIKTSHDISHLNNMFDLDPSFKRTTTGTDIYVTAFKTTGESEFKNNIIAEVLDGFLVAIWQGKLEIIVNGYHINKNTLNEVITEYTKALGDNTIMCYDLLASPDTQWYQIPVSLSKTMPIGAINFGFKLRYDGTNKVSMIRSSGMKIFDKPKLNDSLRFVGIATIEGDTLNNLLRSLENPSHNRWEPQRSSDPSVAKSLLADMYNSLRDKLNEAASNTFDDQVDIEGAGDYLPDDLEESDNNQQEKVTNKDSLNKIISIETKVIEKPKSVAHLETDEIGEDIQSVQETQGSQTEGYGFEGLEHLGSKPHGTGDRELDDIGMLPDDKLGGEEQIMVKAKDMRIFCTNKKEQWYRLIFTPTTSSIKGFVAIQKIAEQNEKMPVKIISVKNTELEFSRNKIGYFKFEENKQVILDFRIKGEEYSTMEVKLYAYKG